MSKRIIINLIKNGKSMKKKKINKAVSEYYRNLGKKSAKVREKRIKEMAKKVGDNFSIDERTKEEYTD
jgi:hypothetical protein